MRAIEQAKAEGHLQGETDSAQILFEIHGLILALHHDARFLRNPGVLDRARADFQRLMRDFEAPPARAADMRMRPLRPSGA